MTARLAPFVIAVLAISGPAFGQNADSVQAQLERRNATGDRVATRALADSLLATLTPGTDQYAEALFWRASTTTTAAEAERDYLRLGIEYPLSPRAPAALFTLAQLELARGDRRAARRHFDRLLADHPRGPHLAKASYWSGRLALDDGDLRAACASLAAARSAVTNDDVELRNQIEYYLSGCAGAAADSIPRPAADSVITRDPAPVDTRDRKAFSVQAGAFNTQREATALAARFKGRGLDARVTGTRAPFRVRIGRYPTREAAAETLAHVRRVSPRAIIVDAEPQ